MTKKIAAKWFGQASHDLEMAAKNIAIGGYDVAAFLAHQAVEKLLKSIFALQGRKIPRTHFIDDMARDLQLGGRFEDNIRDLAGDYTLSRYPDVAEQAPYELYSRRIAEEKVRRARAIFAALRGRTKALREGDDA